VRTLRETQERLFALITAPESVTTMPEARAPVEEIVVGDARRSAVERVDIYANMYFFRLLDVLRADYPMVAEALGEPRFHNLATAYLQAHPSEHPSVRYVGRHLASLLDGWMAELARLEWARVEAFDGPDPDPLTLDDLRALPPDAFATLPLTWVPGTSLLRCQFSVDEEDRTREAPRTIAVWRQGVTVYHRALDPDEELAPTFGLVCERLAAAGDAEAAATRAFALLGRWVADGMIERAT
jgi:hypothetical protein